MKVFQVCTLITPDGAYGGPVRVAVNQTRALLEAGVDVTLLAAAQGFGKELPTEYDGVPVSLFPASRLIPGTGFAGLVAPGLTSYIRSQKAFIDILHIHLARDFITLPVARWAQKNGKPFVVQTHGMIDRSNNPLAIPVDAFFTRPVLSSAKSVLHLTATERLALDEVVLGRMRYRELRNGVPTPSAVLSAGTSTGIEVLFLARLHARKRPLAFIEMARRLAPEFPEASFRLVGPDEGESTACAQAIDDAVLSPTVLLEGALAPELTLSRMAQSSIYVLPSINEPFPMSVLEAMSLGRPVVVTESCGLAATIRGADAGIVVDDSIAALTDAVSTLLAKPKLRYEMGQRGLALIREEFSMHEIQKQLQKTYLEAIIDEVGPVL